MTDKGLIRMAAQFRKGLLGKHSSHLKCAMVAYPLESLLSMMGIECKAREVKLSRHIIGNHVFLILSDGRVLDPTADQFGEAPVYLGKPQWFHRNRGKAPISRNTTPPAPVRFSAARNGCADH